MEAPPHFPHLHGAQLCRECAADAPGHDDGRHDRRQLPGQGQRQDPAHRPSGKSRGGGNTMGAGNPTKGLQGGGEGTASCQPASQSPPSPPHTHTW